MFEHSDLIWLIFILLTSLVFVFILFYTIAQSIRRYTRSRNRKLEVDSMPHKSAPAVVAAKRSQIYSSTRLGKSNGGYPRTETSYYVTFELHGGQRMEFNVSGRRYGSLIEGDSGMLTFQGPRFIRFERIP